MSVSSIIAGGVRVIRNRPGTVAIWCALYLVVIAIGMLALRPAMTSMLAFQQQMAADRAAGVKAPPAMPTGFVGSIFVLDLLYAIAAVVMFAAVVRATTSSGPDRFAYLRLAKDELRLFGLGVIVVVAAFGVEIVAGILLAIVAIVAGLALGKAGAVIVAAILVVALLCAAVYVEVRISLAGALTVLRGRIVIKDAWRATKGHFWTLFAVYLLLTLIFAFVGIALTAAASPALLSAYASMDPQKLNAVAQQQYALYAAGPSLGYLVLMVIGSIVMVVIGVVTCGAITTAALELREGSVPGRPAKEKGPEFPPSPFS